jgi:hypothetical protein
VCVTGLVMRENVGKVVPLLKHQVVVGNVEVNFHTVCTLTQDGDDWSASHSSSFYCCIVCDIG